MNQLVIEWLNSLYSTRDSLSFTLVRTTLALFTSFFAMLLLGPTTIKILRSKQGEIGQPVRDDGPKSHHTKQGTPTMGGVLIVCTIILSTILWTELYSVKVISVLLIMLGFGAVGFYDDYLKVSKSSHCGCSGAKRLTIEFIIASITILILLSSTEGLSTTVTIPFYTDASIDLGLLYVLFAASTVVGTGNAVNLADGLDGLAITLITITATSFAIIAYLIGAEHFANSMNIMSLPTASAVITLLGAVIGASLGFLWFNAPPALLFMGDTGALALGGLLGMIAVVTKHELFMVINGGMFAIEGISVLLQVGSFKLTGKRIFLMAPIHHHFELLGWKETQIVFRFCIIAVFFSLIGFLALII